MRILLSGDIEILLCGEVESNVSFRRDLTYHSALAQSRTCRELLGAGEELSCGLQTGASAFLEIGAPIPSLPSPPSLLDDSSSLSEEKLRSWVGLAGGGLLAERDRLRESRWWRGSANRPPWSDGYDST
jgi:hypothetical protein